MIELILTVADQLLTTAPTSGSELLYEVMTSVPPLVTVVQTQEDFQLQQCQWNLCVNFLHISCLNQNHYTSLMTANSKSDY